ncbi:MAG TPA: hypothetical protein VIH45_09835 [Desulfuromonadaceae bacterium]
MSDELLTVKEFAKRLKVGRSTVFEWQRAGVFLPGRHFIKMKRVLRFIWSDEIVVALSDATTKPPQPATRRRTPSTAKAAGVNWDY